MINLIDTVFVSIGFSETELKASAFRGYLYAGMIFCAGVSAAFMIALAFG